MPKKIQTTDGVLVRKPTSDSPMDDAQADADCADRNIRAAEMGIQTRYEVADL